MTAKECLVEFKRIIVIRTRSLMEIRSSDAMNVCSVQIPDA